MAGEFNSTSKFRVTLVHSDGDTERVSVQIGLDGLKIIDINSNRTTRSYELGHISRWQSRGSSLILYTKTPVDVEERQLTLQGDENTIRSALDVLTCSCMQLAELLQSKQTSDAQETANSLHALVAGDGKKQTTTKLPSADDVIYWAAPAFEGWLQCQGDHLKSWRKRWFVLKQGYLFRFMNATVSDSTKPRGVVDLSKIQDVSQANKITGKQFSFQLKTASGGSVCYLCDSETDLVMWMSAINREIEKIVKKLAGVDDEPPKPSTTTTHKSSSKGSSNKSSGSAAPSEWMRQLEKNFDSLSTESKGRNNYNSGPAMIDVVGYESFGGGGGGGGRDHGRDHGREYSSAHANNSGLDYSNIAGAAAAGGASGGLSADILLNYGGASLDRSGHGASPSPAYPNRGTSSYTAQHSGGYGSSAAPSGYGAGSGGYGSGSSYSAAPNGNGGGAGGYGSAPAAGQGYTQQPSQYAQPQPQPQQQPQQHVSLIDQVPQSQPAYPYYQQGMPQTASASQASQWQVHHTAEGRPYYYNAATGTTQWEPPAGM